MDYVASQCVVVSFSEGSGGDIESDDVRATFVDIFGERLEATLQGLLESAAEQTVDYDIVFAEVGRGEFSVYLRKVDAIHQKEL